MRGTSVLLGAPAETVARVALALRIAVAGLTAVAAMAALRAAAAVRAAVAALRAALPVTPARRPERVAVHLALTVAVLAESSLAVPMRAAALPVPERLGAAAVAGGGAMHGELGNGPRGRVALDARLGNVAG